MRRAFRLSVRVGDQHLAQEVDEMSLIGANSPGNYIDAVTEHMMRQAEHMQYEQETAIIQSQAQMQSQLAYHSSISNLPLSLYPGQAVAGNSSHSPFLQCVGNGWQTATAPVRQVLRNAVKFFRINEEVEMEEGAEWGEPLDELRLKVKRWLKR